MASEGSTDSFDASSLDLSPEDEKTIQSQIEELKDYIALDADVKGVVNSSRLEPYYKRLAQMEVLATKCESCCRRLQNVERRAT